MRLNIFFLTYQLFQGDRFIPPGRKDQKGTLIESLVFSIHQYSNKRNIMHITRIDSHFSD